MIVLAQCVSWAKTYTPTYMVCTQTPADTLLVQGLEILKLYKNDIGDEGQYSLTHGPATVWRPRHAASNTSSCSHGNRCGTKKISKMVQIQKLLFHIVMFLRGKTQVPGGSGAELLADFCEGSSSLRCSGAEWGRAA